MSNKFNVGDRVTGHLGLFNGTVLSIEGDLQDVYKVQWDNGQCLDELNTDLLPEGQEFNKEPVAETKPKKARKAKQPKAEPVNVGTNLADQVTAEGNGINLKLTEPAALVVFLAKDTQVKLTGRIKSKASNEFLTYILTGFEKVEDRLYQAKLDLAKDEFKLYQKTAKKAGLGLEIVEVKEPTKRLTKREREIKAKRLAQLAEARKNLAKARAEGTIVRKAKSAPVSAETAVEASTSEHVDAVVQAEKDQIQKDTAEAA
jgi:hypothetical protein